jgi:RNA polymerase sigma-70 factor (ECF subfamily)
VQHQLPLGQDLPQRRRVLGEAVHQVGEGAAVDGVARQAEQADAVGARVEAGRLQVQPDQGGFVQGGGHHPAKRRGLFSHLGVLPGTIAGNPSATSRGKTRGTCDLSRPTGGLVVGRASRMTRREPDTDHLLDRAVRGDGAARQELLSRHRARLRAMVAARLDRRLAARLDPSDVVQEALAEAARRLDDYLRDRPLLFYPWLRQLAWDRLVKEHCAHLVRARRSVRREAPDVLGLPDESVAELAQRLADSASSPSRHAERVELQGRVRAVLARLGAADREVLVLRYLEQLPLREVAAVLGVSQSAVKMRHFRALERLQALLEAEHEDNQP